MEIIYLLEIPLSLVVAVLWAVQNVAIRIGTGEGDVTDAQIVDHTREPGDHSPNRDDCPLSELRAHR